MKYDVFISHASEDREIAQELCNYLEPEIKCWIAPRNVTGLYARSIINGIKESQLMVLVFSEHANESPHVENEVDNAFNEGKVIIPFRIEDKQMSDVLLYYLRKSHYVDAFPDAVSALGDLKNQIINNLPRLRKELDLDDALKSIASIKSYDLDKLKKMFGMAPPTPIDDSDADDGNTVPPATGSRYDMLQNEAGEILILINYQKTEPDGPRIVYDGGEKALLYRSRESALFLENISLEARVPLSQVEEVLVAEVKDDDVAREYKVPMRIIRKLDFFG